MNSNEQILGIASSMFAQLNVQEVLSVAIDRAIEAAGAERGMIVLFDKQGSIIFETARNLERKDIEKPAFQISLTIIEKVKNSGLPVCLRNAQDDSEFSPSKSVVRLQILSVIALPLTNEHQTFGVLYLDNRTAEGVFSQEKIELVQSLGAFISLAAYNALAHKRLEMRVEALESQLREHNRFESIIGNHPAVLNVLKLVSQVSTTGATVLIQGESGTGKELIARAIHDNSTRSENAFLPINCGAIAEELLESELFGHKKGAFTGATDNRVGWFERADKGTIFLDEVGEMPASLQVKLLRVLQSGEYSPVGSTEIRRCDVRVLAASNKNLKELVKNGEFREDLFFRLNVVELSLPALRERVSDIIPLAEHFLAIHAHELHKPGLQLSEPAKKTLEKHQFPGNIRELRNIIERAAIFVEENVVEPHHLALSSERVPSDSGDIDYSLPFKECKERVVDDFERRYISDCLTSTSGNISEAARISGIDIKNLRGKMKKYKIDAKDFK